MIARLVRLLRRLLHPGAMSDEWLLSHDLSSTKRGWDGPRWRLPAERKALERKKEKR
jgi:hypothetical protein